MDNKKYIFRGQTYWPRSDVGVVAWWHTQIWLLSRVGKREGERLSGDGVQITGNDGPNHFDS